MGILAFGFCTLAQAGTPVKPRTEREDRWLARDKLAHATISLSLVGFGYHLARYEGSFKKPSSRAAAVGITLSLGLLKELRDGTKKDNCFSLRDLAADLAGTAAGIALFTIK